MRLVHIGKRYPNRRRGRTPWNKRGRNQNCLHCGTPFWVPPARFQMAKYCSQRCNRLANNAILTAPLPRHKAALARWSNPLHHKSLSKRLKQYWSEISSAERKKRSEPMLRAAIGRHVSSETRELIRASRLRQVFPTRDTTIERRLQEGLRERQVAFEAHYPILNRCQADIAFPSQRLAVFCDGDYWHSRPDIRSRDITQEMILRANGWRVLRFWEHEIKSDADRVVDHIVKELPG